MANPITIESVNLLKSELKAAFQNLNILPDGGEEIMDFIDALIPYGLEPILLKLKDGKPLRVDAPTAELLNKVIDGLAVEACDTIFRQCMVRFTVCLRGSSGPTSRLSGYNLFIFEFFEEQSLLPSSEQIPAKEKMKVSTQLWKQKTDEVKKDYNDRAEEISNRTYATIKLEPNRKKEIQGQIKALIESKINLIAKMAKAIPAIDPLLQNEIIYRPGGLGFEETKKNFGEFLSIREPQTNSTATISTSSTSSSTTSPSSVVPEAPIVPVIVSVETPSM